MKNKDAMKTNVLLLVIFMLIVISGAVFVNLNNGLGGGKDVIIQNGTITSGVDALNSFKKKAASNQNAFVRFRVKGIKGETKTTLKYKDGLYYYKDANGKEYSDRYLLDLTGYLTEDASSCTRIICLARESSYTFDDLMSGYISTTGDDRKAIIILSLSSPGMASSNDSDNSNNVNSNVDTNNVDSNNVNSNVDTNNVDSNNINVDSNSIN